MNTGIISSRYANALLLYANEKGDAEQTCAQARQLGKVFSAEPELVKVLENPGSGGEGLKMDLLKTALGEKMTESLESFMHLLARNGRLSYLKFMLRSFESAYYNSRHIAFGKLTTAVPAPGLEALLKKSLKEQRGVDVEIETEIDPGIIGGFIFTLDGIRLDSSVSRQIEILRRQFAEKNRRIV